MKAKIVLLPGDGIGGEVVGEAKAVLDDVARLFGHELSYEEHPIGGIAIDLHGTALPPATLAACKTADAILLGAVGGPKWDDPNATVRPEQGLLGLRHALTLFANLRPVRVHPALAAASPLRTENVAGVDVLFVRELTGGLYFGEPRGVTTEGGERRAVDTLRYSETEIRRVVTLSFKLAAARRGSLTSVDKANVLASSRLWRTVTNEVAREFPNVKVGHQLVDSAAMKLLTDPRSFDVIVTENMFGDILTDEASVLAGSLGVVPSASLGDGTRGLYEPIHGSAPDIAGKGIANPIGTILSAALLLRHSLGLEAEARVVERAVDAAIDAGARTRDLGGMLSTSEMGKTIRDRLTKETH